APIPVQIDVLPGESANVIRLQPNRMITVAVLSGAGFDARNVDPVSVVFGPGLGKETHSRGHWEDANGDGLIDLVLHFRCGETGIQPGETSVNLYGRLLNGEIIAGSDTITAVSK
ncbi:MAG: hypothetical protein GTN78_03155, partial [Gemmatimonadales bacterium]|nr:hypothetical protein [Gemmatimonadales bacterium]